MADKPEEHAALIEAIGRAVLIQQLDVSHQQITNWRKRCIPHAHRMRVGQLAILAGAALPDGFFDAPERKAKAA